MSSLWEQKLWLAFRCTTPDRKAIGEKKAPLFSLSRHSTRHTHMLPSLSLPSILLPTITPISFLLFSGGGWQWRWMPTACGCVHCAGIPLRPMARPRASASRGPYGRGKNTAALPIRRCPDLQLGQALVWELPHLTFMHICSIGPGSAPLVTALDKLAS